METVNIFIFKPSILPVVFIYLHMRTIKFYTLADPTTKEIRYVGKTVAKLEYRLAGHICEARAGNIKSHRNSWIRGILSKSLKPVVELIEEIEEIDEWEIIEQFWISQFKAWGFRLVNMTDGGDGNKKQKFSRESIEKRAEAIRERVKDGRICYKDRALAAKIRMTGRVVSDKTKEKLRQANLGKKYSIESLVLRSKGGVIQMDYDYNIINTFISLTEAHKKTGINRGNISTSMRRKNGSCGGFRWKYKNEDIVES